MGSRVNKNKRRFGVYGTHINIPISETIRIWSLILRFLIMSVINYRLLLSKGAKSRFFVLHCPLLDGYAQAIINY